MLKEKTIRFGYERKKEYLDQPICLGKEFQEAIRGFIPDITKIRPHTSTKEYVDVITMTDALVFHLDEIRCVYSPHVNKIMNVVQMTVADSLTADLRKSLIKDILTFDFSKALEHLKQGKAVARKGWNGKGLFVYMVSGGTYKVQMDIVKPLADSNSCMTYEPYFAIWNGRGTINTWVPSVSDLLAEDYVVIEDTKEYVENAKNRS